MVGPLEVDPIVHQSEAQERVACACLTGHVYLAILHTELRMRRLRVVIAVMIVDAGPSRVAKYFG